MTPPCVYCADNRRDIRGLIFRARRDEWAGRPTTETCGRIAELRRAIADCTHERSAAARSRGGRVRAEQVRGGAA